MTKKEIVSAREMMEMLDIIHKTVGCQDVADFQQVARDMQNLIGFSKSTFCWKSLAQSTKPSPPQVTNISFPTQFFKDMKAHEMWKKNPISIRGIRQHGLQSWQETCKMMPPPKKFVEIKSSFNLYDGFSYSTPASEQQGVSMVSIATTQRPPIERWVFILDRLMPHFHLAHKKVLDQSPEIKTHDLTNREVEVLSWLKEGKTSWEISVILNISERTINFHVGNVKKKLNATNRMGAVAQAMHLGLVC